MHPPKRSQIGSVGIPRSLARYDHKRFLYKSRLLTTCEIISCLSQSNSETSSSSSCVRVLGAVARSDTPNMPNTGAATNEGQTTPADPPRRVPDGAVVDSMNSCGDHVLRALQHRTFVFISAVWLLAVVVDGALFFFLMVGWDAVPTEKRKNLMLNTSIQILNYLFTYMSAFNLPDRVAKFVGLFG